MMQLRNRQRLFGGSIAGGDARAERMRDDTAGKVLLAESGCRAAGVGPDGGRARRLGVGPVELPEYLDRPQIVTRMANSELRLADDRRWTESLRGNFTRVLSDGLSTALGTTDVHTFPWWPSQPIDYQVIAKVPRFEGDTSGNVTLVAR